MIKNKCLYVVNEKDTKKPVKVFGVRDDSNGYPQFLIYEDSQWKYRSAKHYYPLGRN